MDCGNEMNYCGFKPTNRRKGVLVDPWGHEIRRSTQKTSAGQAANAGESVDNLASHFEPDNYKSVHNELVYIQKLEFDVQKKVFRRKQPESQPIKT